MLHLLKSTNYRSFFLAFTVGNIAEGLVLVTVPFFVLSVTGDIRSVGICLAAQTAGVLLLAFPGASLSDRFSRTAVIACAYSAATISLLSLALALSLSRNVWLIAICMLFFGASTAVYGPAADAMTPQLVTAENLHRANSMDGLSQRIGQGMVGPLLGGILVAANLGAVSVGISAACCAIGALAILRVKLRKNPVPGTSPIAEERSDWQGVLRFLLRSRTFLLLLLWVSLAVMLQVGAKPVVVPAWLTDLEGTDASTYGIALSLGAASSAAVSILAGSLRLPKRYIQFMILSWSLGSGVFLIAVIFPATWSLLIAYVAASGFMSLGNIYWSTYVQSSVPNHLLTRVISVDWVASLALTPFGAVAAGLSVALLGSGKVFVAIAVIPLVTGLLMLSLKSLKGDPITKGNEHTVPANT